MDGRWLCVGGIGVVVVGDNGRSTSCGPLSPANQYACWLLHALKTCHSIVKVEEGGPVAKRRQKPSLEFVLRGRNKITLPEFPRNFPPPSLTNLTAIQRYHHRSKAVRESSGVQRQAGRDQRVQTRSQNRKIEKRRDELKI